MPGQQQHCAYQRSNVLSWAGNIIAAAVGAVAQLVSSALMQHVLAYVMVWLVLWCDDWLLSSYDASFSPSLAAGGSGWQRVAVATARFAFGFQASTLACTYYSSAAT